MREFLPCTYGYATTIRKAQGASLDYVCLYFDARFPPDRGYGYVGASRCRNAAGLYYFKRLRRTDWLPIRKVVDPDEEEDRGAVSNASSGDDCDYDDWEARDSDSDCSTLRSDGHLSDPETEFDEDGFPIIEDEPDLGDEGGYVPTDGLTEPLDAYADLLGGSTAKRRRLVGGGVA